MARLARADVFDPLVRTFGRAFHRVAGAPTTLGREPFRRKFHPGQAQLLGAA